MASPAQIREYLQRLDLPLNLQGDGSSVTTLVDFAGRYRISVSEEERDAIGLRWTISVSVADDADDYRVGDRPVERQVAAAGHQAGDGVHEGVGAEQHQRAAVERQHHRLDVPVAELEARVVALPADQPRHEQGEARHAGVDGGEHAVEHDRHRSRQQAEHDAERRHRDRHPSRSRDVAGVADPAHCLRTLSGRVENAPPGVARDRARKDWRINRLSQGGLRGC